MKPKFAWILAGCLVVPLAIAATPRRAPSPVTFTAGGDSVEIPFLLRTNHILVRGLANDSDSLWFVVDSGAGSHVLGRRAADRLGLKVTGGVEALGSGGRVQAGRAEDVHFHLAGLDVTGPMTTVIALDAMELQTGQACDGIIGFPLFDHAAVTIDYDHSVLVIRNPDRLHVGGASVPLKFIENHPYVKASVTLPGGKPIAGQFVLDTGSALAVTFNPGFVEKRHALAAVPKTITARLGGVGGQAFHPVGRIENLELGPYTLARPIAVFSSPGPGQTSVPGSIGNLGADVLQRFVVTFDYPHKRLYLEPGLAFTRPFEADMTGLILTTQTDSLHAIAVLRVEKDSPASEAGIAQGDVVESVDGQPLTPGAMPEFRKRMRTEGLEFKLGVRRGETRSAVTLTTRRLI